MTKLFYGLIGITSSLVFFLILYWALRLDSSITSIIINTYVTPLYFWSYVILTFGAIVFFGINVSFLVYRWRKFGLPKFKTEAGAGVGLLFGVAASACPVCGSTILFVLGITGGLATFPLQGLELKALSFGLMILPVWLMRRDLKKLECLPAEASLDLVATSAKRAAKAGGDNTCPIPKDHRFKKSDWPQLFILSAMVIALLLVSWNILKTEPIISRAFQIKT